MTPKEQYAGKLTTPAQAVSEIASGDRVAMGMALAEPPALLGRPGRAGRGAGDR